jgi:FMN-dependent NADH-azoreductase
MSPRLFHLDGSIQSPSVSRSVADSFLRVWTQAHPGGEITHRNLASEPPAYLTGQEFAAKPSTPLLDELLGADVLLLAVPLYNWSVPAMVKTWIDHLMADPRVRAPEPVLTGRAAVVVTARGGAYGPGTPKEGWDHLEPYLQRVLGEVLGLDVFVVKPELTYAEIDPGMFHLQNEAKESLAKAHAEAESLAERLSGQRV